MSENLITWLQAQLDEDEREIAAYQTALAGEAEYIRDYLVATQEQNYPCAPYLRISASRALAEVAAARRLLDLHPHHPPVNPTWTDLPFAEDEGPHRIGCKTCKYSDTTTWWCETVRLLASAHADRDGYQEAWRP